MNFETWEPTYKAILAEFGFDRAKDEESAKLLARLTSRPPYDPVRAWRCLLAHFAARPTIVLGAADDAAKRLVEAPAASRLVVADGATTAALEAGRRPDLIVTDLDGNVDDEIKAVRQGAYVAIHGHGDNMPAVANWLPKFDPTRVFGTCQSEPVGSLQNVGGFTDGDRACHIAHELGASDLLLVGFAFEGPAGKYSGTYDPKTKQRKLAWSKHLIGELGQRDGAKIRFA
ncbi:MAG TPA: 6-hydroxymethylpterin diphosphokinase MptE-like protein [Candidatus Thermoplasmatota archaeon]